MTEQFNLNDIVRTALNIAKGDGYKEFHPILELEQNMPAVLGNRIQVQKVLVNLLRNAVEAMRGVGAPSAAITVTVRTNKDLNIDVYKRQLSALGVVSFFTLVSTPYTGIGFFAFNCVTSETCIRSLLSSTKKADDTHLGGVIATSRCRLSTADRCNLVD